MTTDLSTSWKYRIGASVVENRSSRVYYLVTRGESVTEAIDLRPGPQWNLENVVVYRESMHPLDYERPDLVRSYFSVVEAIWKTDEAGHLAHTKKKTLP